jgi:CrcB protein
MNTYAILAVGIGAAIGAWLRWAIGVHMNPLFPNLPPGTLLSNLIGGYLIGVAVALFANHPGISHETRLFIVTGFLGGLTTFSTFSNETVQLLLRAQYGWAVAMAGAHLFGSLTMTALGIGTVKLLRL